MTDKAGEAFWAFAEAAKAFGRNSSAANYVLMEASALALQEARYVESQARRAVIDHLESATGLVWAAEGTGGNCRAYVAQILDLEILLTDEDGFDLPGEGDPVLIGVYDREGESRAEFDGPDAVRRLMAYLFPE